MQENCLWIRTFYKGNDTRLMRYTDTTRIIVNIKSREYTGTQSVLNIIILLLNHSKTCPKPTDLVEN
jgi:hypothetical protein